MACVWPTSAAGAGLVCETASGVASTKVGRNDGGGDGGLSAWRDSCLFLGTDGYQGERSNATCGIGVWLVGEATGDNAGAVVRRLRCICSASGGHMSKGERWFAVLWWRFANSRSCCNNSGARVVASNSGNNFVTTR